MKITEDAIDAATEVLMRGPEPGSDKVPVRAMLEAAAPFILMQSGDREMLGYLMRQFDLEVSVCSVCGHEESTEDMDSAICLRQYLAANGEPA